MKLPPKLLIWLRGMSPGALDAQPIHYFAATSPALAACRYPFVARGRAETPQPGALNVRAKNTGALAFFSRYSCAGILATALVEGKLDLDLLELTANIAISGARSRIARVRPRHCHRNVAEQVFSRGVPLM